MLVRIFLSIIIIISFVAGTSQTKTDSAVEQAKDGIAAIKSNLDTIQRNNDSINAKVSRIPNVEKPAVEPKVYRYYLDKALKKVKTIVVRPDPVVTKEIVPLRVPVPVNIPGADSIAYTGDFIFIYKSSPSYGATSPRWLTEREIRNFAGPFGSKEKLRK